jgi:hypothetical protein
VGITPHVYPAALESIAKRQRRSLVESTSSTHSVPLTDGQVHLNPLGSSASSFILYQDILQRLHSLETRHSEQIQTIQRDVKELYSRTSDLMEFHADWKKEDVLEQVQKLHGEVMHVRRGLGAHPFEPEASSDFNYEESQIF